MTGYDAGRDPPSGAVEIAEQVALDEGLQDVADRDGVGPAAAGSTRYVALAAVLLALGAVAVRESTRVVSDEP